MYVVETFMSPRVETAQNEFPPKKRSLKREVLLLVFFGVFIAFLVWVEYVFIVFAHPWSSNYVTDLPLGMDLLALGGMIFCFALVILLLASEEFPKLISRRHLTSQKKSKGFFLISIPPEFCHPVYRPFRKVPYICLFTFCLYYIFSRYDPFIEQQLENLILPLFAFWTVFMHVIPMVNIAWRLKNPEMKIEERKNTISRSLLSLLAIPTMSVFMVYLSLLIFNLIEVETAHIPDTIVYLLLWLSLGLLGILNYFVFLDFPFWRGQVNRKRINKDGLNKQRKRLLEKVEKLTDPSEIIAVEMKIQRLEREIDRIKAEPEHPYKGALLIPSVFLTLLISPLLEIILKQLLT